MNSPLYVARPSLAPLDEYVAYLQTIWETGIMTHNGPMLQQLEKDLCDYLGVEHVVCVSNATCAMQLALRALDVEGEVITTPFTFVATPGVVAWERCRPVFVDIDRGTWNIDPDKIEERITDKTAAILAVHVFSAPCDVVRLQSIAEAHGLKLIYDAAHAMAVDLGGRSILRHGDVSALSFHATKLFNTAEGGACVAGDPSVAERLRRMRFFGFDEEKNIVDYGLNTKLTELSAGLGLANLQHLDRVRRTRREQYEHYVSLLSEFPFVAFQQFDPEAYNYSYMPILLDSQERLLCVIDQLHQDDIYPRRYFWPALHTVSLFETQVSLPVAEDVSSRVLCLPLHDGVLTDDIERVCESVWKGGKKL